MYSLDHKQPVPVGSPATLTRMHIRMLLGLTRPGIADLDSLAIQLTAALEGPVLLYLSAPQPTATTPGPAMADRLGDSWQALIERICRTLSPVATAYAMNFDRIPELHRLLGQEFPSSITPTSGAIWG